MRSSNCPRLDPIEQCWALMHQRVPQSGLQNIPAIRESNSEIPETHDSQELEPPLRSNHRQLSASSTLGISGRRLARPRDRSKYLAFWPKRMLGHPVQASVVIAKYICKGARPKARRQVVVETGIRRVSPRAFPSSEDDAQVTGEAFQLRRQQQWSRNDFAGAGPSECSCSSVDTATFDRRAKPLTSKTQFQETA